MKKRRFALAFALILLPGAYTAQAAMKLKRALGPEVSLSNCSFTVYSERMELGAISLPVPRISCVASPRLHAALEYVWTPSRNRWEGPVKTGC